MAAPPLVYVALTPEEARLVQLLRQNALAGIALAGTTLVPESASPT